MHRTAFLATVFALAGCGQHTVHVVVLPTQYQVGDVKSELATPAVDEVVRLKPKRVHISTCYSTPPAKVLQFNVELDARHTAKVTGGVFENCPEV